MAGPAIATVLYIFLRMTIDAPRHPHRRNTGNAVHCFHRAMTFLTREARFDVSLVCEVNKVGYVVNLNPRNRFSLFPVGGQLQDLRTFADAGHRIVTSHAFANAGYAGNRRLVGIDMTMLTRNLIIRGMYRVTEFDGLNRASI